jgi:hypothetical protein
MYGALWRALPGPWWLRVFILLILAVGVVYACFTWLFPWVAGFLAFNDNTVG